MKKTVFCLALSTALATSFVSAKEKKHISQSFELNSEQKIEINVSVGSIEYVTYKGNVVEVDIDIEPSNKGSFFFSSKVDLSEIELHSKFKNDKLLLEIDDDDINQTWVVKVPERLAADIDLGVGAVDIDNFNNQLDVSVGVGEVKVEVNNVNYRNIELEAGVGDTDIEGFSGNIAQRSHLVGSNSQYKGQGDFSISVNVGVGDVEVTSK